MGSEVHSIDNIAAMSYPSRPSDGIELVEPTDTQARQTSNLPSRKDSIFAAVKGINPGESESQEGQDASSRIATKSTYQDAAAMRRMGKDQQMV